MRSRLVLGDEQRVLSSLRVPLGEGLVGWVAQTGKPILNGNPAVEPGYVPSGLAVPGLSSAVALPLEDAGRIIGVVALYRAANGAFAADDLEHLVPMCPVIASILVESEVTTNDTSNLAESIRQGAETAPVSRRRSPYLTALEVCPSQEQLIPVPELV
jgi:signal transduction protein with GAF and PtsI domain